MNDDKIISKISNASISREGLDKTTEIFDYLDPILQRAVGSSAIFTSIQRELTRFFDKNRDALQTNIIGKQLLFNETVQDFILEAIGVDQEKLTQIIEESSYFELFRAGTKELKLTEQIVFAFPMILLSAEYYKRNKMREAEYIYLLAFFKPYATRISRYFPYGVNEDQMRYTIEHLSERFDIKSQQTVLNFLIKTANSSFNRYVPDAVKEPTDRNLHVIFTSGIYTAVNNKLNKLVGEYLKNKGKYLPFEDATFDGTDDSEGETFERDIKSDAAVKNQMVRKAVNIMNSKPVNQSLLEVAVGHGFGGKLDGQNYKVSNVHLNVLRNLILEVSDKMYKKLPVFFESMIGSFLFEKNPTTGRVYSAGDLKTPLFTMASVQTFKYSPNTSNRNIITVREMVNEMLENHSNEYLNYKSTLRTNLRNALHFYFVLLIQKG
jgi:hypothetical protein